MSSFAHSWKTGLAVAAGAGSILAVGQPAFAADVAKPRAAQLQAVVDCRKLTDPAERLACYDGATAKLEAAEKAGDVVVVDREQVREAQRSAFGFNFRMPTFISGDSTKGEKLQSLESTVAEARTVNGKWVIVLADGAIWNQTDNEPIGRSPKAGSKVTIRQGSVGSFFLSVDGQRSVRAKRQN